MDYKTRQASDLDEEWLYDLYCTTMRTYIEKTWGWDETFQKNGFRTNLCPTKFNIVVVGDEDVGAYLMNEEPDHYWLEMMLIDPMWQRKGLGSNIIRGLQVSADQNDRLLKLSVIKVNPVKDFYTRLGFEVYEEDQHFYKLIMKNAR